MNPPACADPPGSDPQPLPFSVGRTLTSTDAGTGRLVPLDRYRCSLGMVLSCAALVALAIPVGFALHTGSVWEDFLITFRQSRNLAEGNGLVYQIGERVHGFTSPLNVLLPALWQWMWPAEDFHPAFWFLVVVGLGVFVTGFVVLARTLVREFPHAHWIAVAVPLLTVLQVKTTAFAVNGQETGFLVGFLALGLCAALRGFRENWVANGLCWAGLMWTRPDSPVYVAALGLAGLLFNGQPKSGEWRGLVRAALLCTALYLPWFIGTWSYFGSPVPHTIRAKFDLFQWSMTPGAIVKRMLAGAPAAISRAFEPIYAEAGGWPAWLAVFSTGMGIVAAGYCFLPSRDRLGRMASIVFLCGFLYLSYVAATSFPFPWYFTPLGFSGAVVWGCILGRLASQRAGRMAALITLGVLATAQGWLFAQSLRQVQIQQLEIENGTRRIVGLWLRMNAKAGATVMLEPIGYIGYYSGLHILDWPGLVAPAVVTLRRESHLDFLGTARALKPDWLVLRTDEYNAVTSDPELRADYQEAVVVDAVDRVLKHGPISGINYLFADARFFVLRRNAE